MWNFYKDDRQPTNFDQKSSLDGTSGPLGCAKMLEKNNSNQENNEISCGTNCVAR